MIQKFIFDNSFDEKTTVPEAPPPPKEPDTKANHAQENETFQKGFEEGFERGLKHHQSTYEEQMLQTLQKICTQFDTIREEAHQHNQSVLSLSATFVKETLQKVFPFFSHQKRLVESDLEATLTPLLETLKARPCKIIVHPNVAGFVESRLKSLVPDLPIQILHDSALSPGDSRIEWEHASVEHVKERLREEVFNLLDEMVSTAPREQKEEMC